MALEESQIPLKHKTKISANVLLDEGPFCGPTDCPYFGLNGTVPMGFKSRVVLLPALTCLHVLNLSIMSGAIPAYVGCVHCTVDYT